MRYSDEKECVDWAATRFPLCAFVTAALLWVAHVDAAIVTYDCALQIPNTSTNGQMGRTWVTQSADAELSQFAPRNGELTKVTLAFDALLEIESQATLIWDSELTEAGSRRDFVTKIGYHLSGPCVSTVRYNYHWNWNNFPGKVDSDDAPDYTGDDAYRFSTWGGGPIHGGGVPDCLEPYKGDGSVTVEFFKDTYSDPERTNYATRFDATGISNATVTVTYEFTPSIPGDLDLDGIVDSHDLDIIRSCWGTQVTPGELIMGDATGDGQVDSHDLDLIRSNWERGAVATPEPSIVVFGLFGLIFITAGRTRSTFR